MNLAFAFAEMPVQIENEWAPADHALAQVFSLYPPAVERPRLVIRIAPWAQYRDCVESADMQTRYGFFYHAAWRFGNPTEITFAARPSPLRLIRPLVDPEAHRTPASVPRVLHERVFTTFTQFREARDRTFLHGAAMVSPAGHGLFISGHGGVGKTSLALELGLNRGWQFLTDDLLVLDRQGVAHFNANFPKIYAYNTAGDKVLEKKLLANRGATNLLHWRLLRRWPNRVRRSISPDSLYPGHVSSNRLDTVLFINRGPYRSMDVQPLGLQMAVDASIDVLKYELRGITPDLENYLTTLNNERPPNTWDPLIWSKTTESGLARARLLSVEVPDSLTAMEYRRQIVDVLANLGIA